MKDCYDHDSGAGLITKPMDENSEHDKVMSRLTGHPVEIAFGPLPAGDDPSKGGLVPANPFSSSSQQRYMYSHPEILGKKGLKEWSSKTDFKSLPEKKRK